MQKEFYLTGNKKDSYPTKSTINLYYKEDKTTRPSTIALYVLFFAVVALAFCKLFVFDILMELNSAKAELAKNEAYLESQMKYLTGYNDVSSQYSRYSYSYLTEDEILCDRMEVLAMLEETVFKQSNIETVVITNDVVSLSFKGLNLEETALLVKEIQNYDIVEKVDVNTASLNSSSDEKDNLATKMVITLASEETGGVK